MRPVYLFLRRRTFREEAKRHFQGAVGQQRVPASFLGSAEIPVPPGREAQQALASHVREQLSEVHAALRVSRAMSVDRRQLVEAVVDRVLDDVRAAGVPDFALADLVQERPRYGTSAVLSAGAEGTPTLRMGNIVEGRVVPEDLKYATLTQKSRTALLLRPGDVLVNRTNCFELVGKAAVYESNDDMVFASYLMRLRVAARIRPRFLVFWINSGFGRAFVRSVVTRAIGQVNINAGRLGQMRIPVPSLPVQDGVIAYLDEVYGELVALGAEFEAQAEALGDLEQAILEQAMRGGVVR